jgi:hypothetical protein
MTNVELRAELKRRGSATSGNKKDLLARLRAAVIKELEQSESTDTSNINDDGTSADGTSNGPRHDNQVGVDRVRRWLRQPTGVTSFSRRPRSKHRRMRAPCQLFVSLDRCRSVRRT